MNIRCKCLHNNAIFKSEVKKSCWDETESQQQPNHDSGIFQLEGQENSACNNNKEDQNDG
jgi:hypothetical protein